MRQNSSSAVAVIGAGLAGSEAAWQLALRGVPVDLFEMRPVKQTAAHTGDSFAELVCSNSFGSDSEASASRILKDELQLLGSLTLQVAREFCVPAGASLAVDREKFSAAITRLVENQPLINLHRQEITALPKDRIIILATGPLTSDLLAKDLQSLLGQESLYFYDAISPIVSAESLDREKIFAANRYGKGETPDFLNIPLDKNQYETLVQDLLTGDVVLPHDFEEEKYFEGCMPVEALAKRGPKTLSFGPMKPVGLDDPKTGRRPYAVVQLRTENRHKTAYNLVGFQTKLKYKEQERIFRKLPGLENAEFLRLGSLHRNTYIHSPSHLLPTLQLKKTPTVFIAGQLTGTEGYLESSAGGLLAGLNAARLFKNEIPVTLPETTMLGALLQSITDVSNPNFQPRNVNFGILPPLPEEIQNQVRKDKKARNSAFAKRSEESLKNWLIENGSALPFQPKSTGTPLVVAGPRAST